MAIEANKIGGTKTHMSKGTRELVRGRRTSELSAILVEGPEEIGTSVERAVRLLESFRQVDTDEIFNSHERWVPAFVIDTAVQPIDGTVRARFGSNLL
jgi:hypothetical protein